MVSGRSAVGSLDMLRTSFSCSRHRVVIVALRCDDRLVGSPSLLASHTKARRETEIRRLLRLASELIDAEGHHAHATSSHDERILGKIGKSLELGAERIEATVAHEARHEDRIDPLVDKRRHMAQKQLRCKAALIDGKTVAHFERAAIRRRIEHDLEPKLCKEGAPRYAVAVVQKRARDADAPDIGKVGALAKLQLHGFLPKKFAKRYCAPNKLLGQEHIDVSSVMSIRQIGSRSRRLQKQIQGRCKKSEHLAAAGERQGAAPRRQGSYGRP